MSKKADISFKVDHRVKGGVVYSLLLWVFLLSFTAFTVFMMLPFTIFRAGRILHRMARMWAWVLIKVTGIKIEVEGWDRLYRNGPVIFLCNHQSLLDVVALFHAIDVPFVFMAKSSLFKIPFFGWAMHAAGYIPVERGQSAKARQSLFNAAEKISKGRSVMIFPEGTRGHPDGSLLPFKKGAFLLAKKAGVHIQPITIYGANEVMPAKQSTLLQRLRRGKTIRLVLHIALEPEDYASWSVDQLSAYVYKVVDRPLDRLRIFNEILNH